jgi:CBS domain containing-hemolysin-like protein
MTLLVLAFVAFAVLLSFSAVFSGSETAFFSLSRFDLERFDPQSRVRRLMRDPEKLLVTILVGNTLVNTAAASIGAIVALHLFPPTTHSASITLTYEVLVVTLIILVFGEVTPKMLATQKNIAVARVGAVVLTTVMRAFGIIVDSLAAFVLRIGGHLAKSDRPFITAEELRTIVAVEEERGTLEEQERDMIHSVMAFGDTVVRELMVPRADMECLEDSTTVAETVVRAKEIGFSRLPVYDGDIDHIVGVLYVKDLLRLDTDADRGRPIAGFIRPAYFTPENKKADDLLRELQRKRIHIAIVVDEYGGTAGLVTLEDLVEEIVGDIRDEYDEEEPLVRVVDERTVVADGSVRLGELAEELGVAIEAGDVDTLGGYLMDAFGRIPAVGETLERNGLGFVVEAVHEQRITKVRVTRLEGPPSGGPSASAGE